MNLNCKSNYFLSRLSFVAWKRELAADMNVLEMELQQLGQEEEEVCWWDADADDDFKGFLPPVPPLPALKPSQKRCKAELLDAIANPEIATITVSGCRGLGRRTILQHAVKQMAELFHFDVTMLISIRGDEVDELQEKIAKEMSLDVEPQESVHSLATKIRSSLLGKKYFLCLYFGKWIDAFGKDLLFEFMEEVGIPRANQQNGCKLVASGSLYEVNCDRIIDVQERLSEEEKWELFREKAGEVVDSPNIQPFARGVADWASNCTQYMEDTATVINLAGAVVKDLKDESLWKELSQRFDPIEFWFKRVASDEEKICCMICYLFGYEYEIDINELISFLIIMDGLLDGSDEEEGGMMMMMDRKKGLGVLKRLLDFCILQRVTHNSVRMHGTIWLEIINLDGRYKESDNPLYINWAESINLSLRNIQLLQDMSPRCPKLLTLVAWGSSKSDTIPEAFFEQMPKLRILYLHRIVSFPSSISNLHNLRALVLRKCKILQMELHFWPLKKLVVLDVSGTLIESLPESVLGLCNLRKLLAKNCCFLKRVPDLDTFEKLKVLDVSGTLIESLPASVSNLGNLQKLLAKNCCFLKNVPNLATLEKLKVLDLSGTLIESLPESVSNLGNLRKLLAKNCCFLKSLHDLAALQKLKVLDLSGTGIAEFPSWIFNLIHLRCLNWYQHGFDSSIRLFPNKFTTTIHVSDANFFCTFPKYAHSLPQCLQRFYFLLSPLLVDHVGGDENYFKRKKFVYNHIYLKAKYFPNTFANCNRWFEINGSFSPWGSIGGALNHTDLLSLKDNMNLLSLSELGLENMKELRGCLIERCHGMEIILREEDVKDGKILEKLENLFISNLLNLTSICSGAFPPGNFTYLKHVYLDCCPKLKNVFSSPLLVENLETLEIKFCDKLEVVFLEEVEMECVLPNLKSLVLWELLELKSICRGENFGPQLEKVKVKECPKLNMRPLDSYYVRTQPENTGDTMLEQPEVPRRRRRTISRLRSGFIHLKKKIFTSITRT